MKQSDKDFGSARAKIIWETLFLLWAIVVNLLYYAQFKAFFISRLGPFIHRWH